MGWPSGSSDASVRTLKKPKTWAGDFRGALCVLLVPTGFRGLGIAPECLQNMSGRSLSEGCRILRGLGFLRAPLRALPPRVEDAPLAALGGWEGFRF